MPPKDKAGQGGGHEPGLEKEHAPSESVFTVCGSLADFIIAVNVIISVLSSRLQPVHRPLIRRIKCFWKENKFKYVFQEILLFWEFQLAQGQIYVHIKNCNFGGKKK